jgi:hypothetical protein
MSSEQGRRTQFCVPIGDANGRFVDKLTKS